MTVQAGQQATNTVAVQVIGPQPAATRVHLSVVGTAAVFVGPKGVTTTTGLAIANSQAPTDYILEQGDSLWAISAASQTLTYLMQNL